MASSFEEQRLSTLPPSLQGHVVNLGTLGTLGPRLEPGVNPAFSVDEESDAMDAFFKQVRPRGPRPPLLLLFAHATILADLKTDPLSLQVEEARALTRGVKEHVKEMRRLHSQVLSSPRPDQSGYHYGQVHGRARQSTARAARPWHCGGRGGAGPAAGPAAGARLGHRHPSPHARLATLGHVEEVRR